MEEIVSLFEQTRFVMSGTISLAEHLLCVATVAHNSNGDRDIVLAGLLYDAGRMLTQVCSPGESGPPRALLVQFARKIGLPDETVQILEMYPDIIAHRNGRMEGHAVSFFRQDPLFGKYTELMNCIDIARNHTQPLPLTYLLAKYLPARLGGTVLVALSGKARVGKDTLADYICSEYQGVSAAFAQPITATAKFMGFSDEEMYHRKERCNSVIGLSVRAFKQRFGESMRKEFGSTIFIRVLKARMDKIMMSPNPPKVFVISDLRFPDELQMVREWGGKIIRIQRDVPAVRADFSETALDNYRDWDCVIDNNGTMDELFEQFNVFWNGMENVGMTD